ncbi:MAG TPA: hypothetical protein VMT72_04230 [Pseudolabrys sp.]|nr:hypothetical protein [Pseudolabrys sp.]
MHKSTVVLGCAAAVATAAALWPWDLWRIEHSLNIDLRGRVDELECPDGPPPNAPALPAANASDIRQDLASVEAQPAASVARPRFAPDLQQRLLKNPEYRKVLRAQQRVVLDDEFRDLPKILGLSPEQSDRLFVCGATGLLLRKFWWLEGMKISGRMRNVDS